MPVTRWLASISKTPPLIGGLFFGTLDAANKAARIEGAAVQLVHAAS